MFTSGTKCPCLPAHFWKSHFHKAYPVMSFSEHAPECQSVHGDLWRPLTVRMGVSRAWPFVGKAPSLTRTSSLTLHVGPRPKNLRCVWGTSPIKTERVFRIPHTSQLGLACEPLCQTVQRTPMGPKTQCGGVLGGGECRTFAPTAWSVCLCPAMFTVLLIPPWPHGACCVQREEMLTPTELRPVPINHYFKDRAVAIRTSTL